MQNINKEQYKTQLAATRRSEGIFIWVFKNHPPAKTPNNIIKADNPN